MGQRLFLARCKRRCACHATRLLFHVTESFLHALLYLHLVLKKKYQQLKDENVGPFFCSLSVWVIKNIILHSISSGGCEKFYLTINEAQIACVTILNKERCSVYLIKTDNFYLSGDKKVMCKNVMRLNTVLSYKFDVLGFFKVDAKFPLDYIGLVTTYAVLLLQFSFNK
ncbi:uncharacterized protein LOC106137959 [Amyelois transitella]|uniref:uncharacterized protein LOC106137959 n=1 Tax=Amyelois transitella TaxID=680683 RepID=UPI0029901EF7|nr:uncharacterized protein LOC106137959 [Amyelois transitella]